MDKYKQLLEKVDELTEADGNWAYHLMKGLSEILKDDDYYLSLPDKTQDEIIRTVEAINEIVNPIIKKGNTTMSQNNSTTQNTRRNNSRRASTTTTRTRRSNNRRQNNTPKNAKPLFDRIAMLVDVTEKGGQVVMRAMLGEWGKEVAATTINITAEELKTVCQEQGLKLTGDSAKLIAVIKATKLLTKKLKGDKKAQYSLQIVQSSKNVNGWLSGTMKRNAETIVTLHGYVSRLFEHFTDVRSFKRPAGVVKHIIADGIKTEQSAEASTQS